MYIDAIDDMVATIASVLGVTFYVDITAYTGFRGLLNNKSLYGGTVFSRIEPTTGMF